MEEKQKTKNITIVKDYENIRELLTQLGCAETQYKLLKAKFENQKTDLILTTNWNEINEERQNEGLAKISNQSMKDAYILKELADLKAVLDIAELKYTSVKRDYEIALRYSIDVLR